MQNNLHHNVTWWNLLISWYVEQHIDKKKKKMCNLTQFGVVYIHEEKPRLHNMRPIAQKTEPNIAHTL